MRSGGRRARLLKRFPALLAPETDLSEVEDAVWSLAAQRLFRAPCPEWDLAPQSMALVLAPQQGAAEKSGKRSCVAAVQQW
ncbi:hypothetical protein NDU88_003215 [Pleurodeles waltl]|uniref:Uncharacterized protein n=1 Tax=Pleurodeles waltl TaxID=8319 RepID=A0AAV7WRS0_PLEWA|nr:hypothetical protein NDU88_003215 [Pleurodeles waltl]